MSANARRKPRILVVEDEALVAFTLTEMLEELGCEPIGPIATADEALRCLPSTTIDAAVVDLLLRGVDAWPVAEALAARKVPFVLATGWSVETLPPHWEGCRVLTKPYQLSDLQSVMSGLLPQAP